ncbi:hypothetical protein IAU60_000961 [Kwoniella sp. DSM 27419]
MRPNGAVLVGAGLAQQGRAGALTVVGDNSYEGSARDSVERAASTPVQAWAGPPFQADPPIMKSGESIAPTWRQVDMAQHGDQAKARRGGSKAPARGVPGWTCRLAPSNIMSMLRFDHPPSMLDAPSPPLVAGEGKVRPLARALAHAPAGYPSSRFCNVLRILAGLSRPTTPSRTSPPIKASPPVRTPPVWAESRQELCEALPYYRSFQSGLYMHSRVAFGYLLEAFPAPRDIWAHQGKVVISHGGGQCVQTLTPDGRAGPAALKADQARSDARVDTLLTAYERRTPIVLIAGEGYDHLPWTLGCAYVVLGWYWISLVWVEAEHAAFGIPPHPDRTYFHRYKVRFDWVEEQGEPWWLPQPAVPVIQPVTGPAASASSDKAHREPPPSDPLSREGDDMRQPPVLPGLLSRGEVPDLLDVAGQTTARLTLENPQRGAGQTITPAHSSLPALTAGSKQELSASERRWPGEGILVGKTPLVTFRANPDPYDTVAICDWCHQPIIQIYTEGLICVRPTCRAFFMLVTGIGLVPIPPGLSLGYTDGFLQPRQTPQEVKIPYNVVPPEPGQSTPETDKGVGGVAQSGVGSRTLWRGWVCGCCGRANCRYRWEVWECRGCGVTLAPLEPTQTLSLESVQPAHPPFMGDAKVHELSGVGVSTRLTPLGVVLMYTLGTAGKVYHLIASDLSVADGLFERYHVTAATGGWFQRRALKANTATQSPLLTARPVKGQLLAQHFAVNSGASYKYIVDTMSFPFDASPSCILEALAVITDTVDMVLGERVGFNEILSVMYREGQKMSWHDDGEEGLGPVVASLSLGSEAIMSFRAKQPRSEPNATFRLGPQSVRPTPPTALSFTLSHGDVMIMQGREIQRWFDHRVIPQGFRVAATARVIGVGEA